MFPFKSVFSRSLRVATLFAIMSFSQATLAQETLYAYGPGGPAPAMKEAAAAFEKTTGVDVSKFILEFLEKNAEPGKTKTRGKG